ncbi:speriolin-like [Dendrobates tinctorius]|uniref:speriolin-like n=1 Tax=Dendrobates tinctorius TaxID=92724 RepID=UPI003CC92BFC
MDAYPCLDPEKVKKYQRIVGEMAFQLDRRILSAIFLEQQRLYGYCVCDIEEKILQVTTNPQTSKVNEKLRSDLLLCYHHIMEELQMLGYIPEVHGHFTEHQVNNFGIIKEGTIANEEFSSINDPQYLRNMISEYMPCDSVTDVLVILECLAHLAKEDGTPLFIH